MSRKEKPTFVTEKEPFPQRLKTLLEESGTTQTELANYIGCTRQAISLYVTGQSTPDINVLSKISNYFNVSADYLLGRTTISSPDTKLKSVCEYTGLSEDAVKSLLFIKDDVQDFSMIELLSNVISSDEIFDVLFSIFSFYESLYLAKDSSSKGFVVPAHSFQGAWELKESIKEFSKTTNVDFNSMLLVCGKESLTLLKDNMKTKFTKLVVNLFESKYKKIYEQRYVETDVLWNSITQQGENNGKHNKEE